MVDRTLLHATRVIIPYGIDAWTGAASSAGASFPVAAIDIGSASPLRFNTVGYKDEIMSATRSADPHDAVRLYLGRLCAPWDRAARRFLDRYVDALGATIAAAHAKADGRVPTFDGLFQRRDWLFSAPIPLPRAHLPAPEGTGSGGAPADFVAADFAFWLGSSWVAVLRPATTPHRTAARAARLRRAGIAIVEWDEPLLDAAPKTVLDRLFEPLAGDFWLDGGLPCGPFRPAALHR